MHLWTRSAHPHTHGWQESGSLMQHVVPKPTVSQLQAELAAEDAAAAPSSAPSNPLELLRQRWSSLVGERASRASVRGGAGGGEGGGEGSEFGRGGGGAGGGSDPARKEGGELGAVLAAEGAQGALQPVPAFTLLKALYGKRVASLAAGRAHVLAMCEGGVAEVLSWGQVLPAMPSGDEC